MEAKNGYVTSLREIGGKVKNKYDMPCPAPLFCTGILE
jgi:hypothetical protein